MYGHDEVRFTTKGNVLYVFVLNPSTGSIKLPVLGHKTAYNTQKIKKICMLGKEQAVEFIQKEDALVLNIPSLRPNKYATVFKVVFDQ